MKSFGYIRLPRTIREKWIWDDPLYFQWWVDMVCEASWQERTVLCGKQLVSLQPGQLLGSISYFVKRWKRSKTMVLHFLSLLEKDGMIEKESSHNITVITIVGYPSRDDFSAEEKDNLLDVVSSSESTDYEREGDNLEDNLEDNLGVINKKINNINKLKKINNTSSSSSFAREDFFELRKDEKWMNQVVKRFGVPLESISSYLDVFAADMEIRGRSEGHLDVRDFKEHFCSWLHKELRNPIRKGVRLAVAPGVVSPESLKVRAAEEERRRLEQEEKYRKQKEDRLAGRTGIRALLTMYEERASQGDVEAAREAERIRAEIAKCASLNERR